MTKIVNSWNEWDPLKRVIVGRPEGTHGACTRTWLVRTIIRNLDIPLGNYGKFPQEMVRRCQ